MNAKEKTICVLGTFDTKSQEFGYLIDQIRALGADVISVDAGFHGTAALRANYPPETVIREGGSTPAQVRRMHRSDAMAVAIRGAGRIVRRLTEEKMIHGVIGMGGSGGTTLASEVMRELPLGFPKVIISTLGGTAKIGRYVGSRDILVLNSVVDVSGINSITRVVFSHGAGAVVGAALAAEGVRQDGKKRIAATMYGLTTPAVTYAKEYLVRQGYEVIVFHATGSGGRAMEELIREGFFDGVLDMTLPEIHSHVLHVASSDPGPGRLVNAARMGIPLVAAPGAMDMVSTTDFSQYPDRKIYCHNTAPSHFRPNAQDVQKSGAYIADALNQATGPCAFYFPHGGLSMVGVPGEIMSDPPTDSVLCDTIRATIDPARVEFHESELDINDKAFALTLAQRLDEMIAQKEQKE